MMKEIEKYPAKYNVVFPTEESFTASNQGGGEGGTNMHFLSYTPG